MKKFDNFIFKSFNFDKQNLKAYFFYCFDFRENNETKEVLFEEVIDFKNDFLLCDIKSKDEEVINNILFNIHISLGISYYKLYPTENLIIKSGFLDEKQTIFWKNFYINGLGEFFIKNNVDPKGLLNFQNFNKNNSGLAHLFIIEGNKILLPWGGGKDSIVSSILLEKSELEITPFVFGKIDDIKKHTLEVFGKSPILIKRYLSKQLFILNEQGYYNGHVPITGIIAFVSQLVCYLYNYKYIILSNERSASEENVIWKGLKINHQYSKSLEFEKDFNEYIRNYISRDSKYFSLLRGVYEYKIAEIFSTNANKYFSSFSSCNKNFVINSKSKVQNNWCNKCEKCCFVYLILSSFLTETELNEIFGKDLFQDKSLLTTFEELIGISGNKPFECVGTYEESLFSAYKTIKKYKQENLVLPYVLLKIEDIVVLEVDKIGENTIEGKLLKIYNEDLIPEEIKKAIF